MFLYFATEGKPSKAAAEVAEEDPSKVVVVEAVEVVQWKFLSGRYWKLLVLV